MEVIMKKMFSLFILLVAILSVVACGGGGSDNSVEVANPSTGNQNGAAGNVSVDPNTKALQLINDFTSQAISAGGAPIPQLNVSALPSFSGKNIDYKGDAPGSWTCVGTYQDGAFTCTAEDDDGDTCTIDVEVTEYNNGDTLNFHTDLSCQNYDVTISGTDLFINGGFEQTFSFNLVEDTPTTKRYTASNEIKMVDGYEMRFDSSSFVFGPGFVMDIDMDMSVTEINQTTNAISFILDYYANGTVNGQQLAIDTQISCNNGDGTSQTFTCTKTA